MDGSGDATTHERVSKAYAEVSRRSSECCGPSPRAQSERIGYSARELDAVPEGVNLGLGCGNPTAGLTLRRDAVVLDLGSGAGMDAFVVARELGEKGRVIGVDMTPEMIALARRNASEVGLENRVEFRPGTIEELPVDDASIDVVVSNCVINLSPDKPRVFREAFRVLRSGGQLSISDIVLTAPLPVEISELAAMHVACVAGAALAQDYLDAITAAGFVDVEVESRSARAMFEGLMTDPLLADSAAGLSEQALEETLDRVQSYRVRARKP